MSFKQTHIARYLLISAILGHLYCWSYAASLIEIPGSFHPVGSGARAMGMGGAFMGIADDATASSWNPAALIHLKKPEFSLVVSYDHLQEKNHFSFYPESTGKQPVSKRSINYFSMAFPLVISGTNMFVATSAQRLYSLSRHWHFPFIENTDIESYTSQHDYEQTGDLYAMGLSWCLEILQPKLSFGITINNWEDGLFGDEWERRYQVVSQGIYGTIPYIERQNTIASYSFKGHNAIIGIVWDINEKWRLGSVVKTPFNATVNESVLKRYYFQSKVQTKDRQTKDVLLKSRLEMPLTWGFGILYRYHENFYLAVDFYETKWHHFLMQYEGQQICPLSGRARNDFQLDRTYQVRIGGEYIWINPIQRRLIPFRVGLFYDPMPSENNGNDIYGFSLGTGWTILDQFSIDIAYQFRYGNDIGGHYLSNLGFSQDIRESKVYCSIILY
jgi:long-subunit fatty acid transport protein